MAVDVQSGIGFAIDLHSTTDGRIAQRMDALTLPDVLCATHKNLVNFGPLTPEFTKIIWQPFRRQMGELDETLGVNELSGAKIAFSQKTM